jgi:hypothetical protein
MGFVQETVDNALLRLLRTANTWDFVTTHAFLFAKIFILIIILLTYCLLQNTKQTVHAPCDYH